MLKRIIPPGAGAGAIVCHRSSPASLFVTGCHRLPTDCVVASLPARVNRPIMMLILGQSRGYGKEKTDDRDGREREIGLL
jgi:hypothetical protein